MVAGTAVDSAVANMYINILLHICLVSFSFSLLGFH